MNFLQNNFDLHIETLRSDVGILLVSETTFDSSFPH